MVRVFKRFLDLLDVKGKIAAASGNDFWRLNADKSAMEFAPMTAGGLTPDELAAVQGAASPSALNPFATMADVGSSSATDILHAALLTLATTPNTPLAILGFYNTVNYDSIFVANIDDLLVGDTVTIAGHSTEDGDRVVSALYADATPYGSPGNAMITFTTDFNAQPPATEGTASWIVGAMSPLQWYRITDFQTTLSSTVGPVEPLLVMATSKKSLAVEAHSKTFPTDIIHYQLANMSGNYTSTHGVIIRRITAAGLDAPCDLRNFTIELAESVLASGVYDLPVVLGQHDPLAALKHFHLFHCGIEEGVFSQNHTTTIDYHANHAPQIVFQGAAMKSYVGKNQDFVIFAGTSNINDGTIGSCCGLTFYSGIHSSNIGSDNYGHKFLGGVSAGTEFGASVMLSDPIVDGGLTAVKVWPGYAGDIKGDRTNELIGWPAPVVQSPDGSSYRLGVDDNGQPAFTKL